MKFLEYNEKNRNELILQIKKHPHRFQQISEKWRDDFLIVMYAIDVFPYNYKYISERLKRNTSIVVRILLKNAFLFYLFPDEIRQNKEICLLAIRTNSFNVHFIPCKLRDDEDIFFELLTKNYYFATYINRISDRIRNDKNVMRKVAKINLNSFFLVSSTTKENIEFMKEMLIKYKFPLNRLTKSVIKNLEILKIGLQQDIYNFFYIPETVLDDSKILIELYCLKNEIRSFLFKEKHLQYIDKYHFSQFIYLMRKEEKTNIFHCRDITFCIRQFI